MMMKGSTQDWKFTTISKYTSITEKIKPTASPEKTTASCPPGRESLRSVPRKLLSNCADAHESADTPPRSRSCTLA